MASASVEGTSDRPVVTGTTPPTGRSASCPAVSARRCRWATREPARLWPLDPRPKPGAASGRTVALAGGSMYAQYRVANATSCLVLPQGTSAKEGASSFVNPLTALGMVETMRREGRRGLVHTAAASNLGQMLVKLCLEGRCAARHHRSQARAGGVAASRWAPRTSAIPACPPSWGTSSPLSPRRPPPWASTRREEASSSAKS